MKEIKFRAWDIRMKEWIGEELDDLIIFRNNELIISDRFALMQFTGLKDKNGKEIYEGDIVIADFNNGSECSTVGEVCFESGGFIVGSNDFEDFYKPLYDFEFEEGNCFKLKVIGNKFENLELLK